MPEAWQEGGFGLYIHWPFCAAKCPYCDFNSHVVAQIDQGRWARAYEAEIDRAAAETQGRVLRSVFFGGGTPSLMAPEVVDAVLRRVRGAWTLANDVEITLEANPTSVEAGRFAGYREAGVNRISLGVQALNDADLKRLGRLHSAQEALAALELARDTFSRVSFDLIYARQDQSLTDWQAELRQALELQPDHLSLYQLTIEEGTAFGARHAAGGLRGLPDEDLAADLYFATQELCAAAGLPAYEISNHARPGAESRHNLIYWRGGDYAGIGPGAHGRLTLNGTRWASRTHLEPAYWLRAVEEGGSGELPREPIGREDRLIERLMMGMRLREGVPLDALGTLGMGAARMRHLAPLEEAGFVEIAEESLRLTEAGRPLLNVILREILAA